MPLELKQLRVLSSILRVFLLLLQVLEIIDEERCNVMKLFNAEPLTAKEWLSYAYDVEGNTLYEAIRNNEGYRGIYAPTSLNNRYL